MAKEVRCIMFSAEEVRGAVEAVLNRSGSFASNRHVWNFVELSERDGGVSAAAKSQDKSVTLDPGELMKAILLYCRATRVPLSNRSLKRLELSNGNLVLVMSINLETVEPVVIGDAVVYAPAGEDAQFSAASSHASRFATL